MGSSITMLYGYCAIGMMQSDLISYSYLEILVGQSTYIYSLPVGRHMRYNCIYNLYCMKNIANPPRSQLADLLWAFANIKTRDQHVSAIGTGNNLRRQQYIYFVQLEVTQFRKDLQLLYTNQWHERDHQRDRLTARCNIVV